MKLFLILSAFLVASTIMVNAQSQDLSVSPGSVCLEVLFRPANNTPITTNHIKGRYFVDNRMAFRFGVELDIDIETNEVNRDIDTTKVETVERSLLFALYPGVEWHRRVSERVSPYFGVDLGYENYHDLSKEHENGTLIEESKNVAGRHVISLNGVAGTDIFVYKGLYMGVEIGYGISTTFHKDSEVTQGDETTKNHNNMVEYSIRDTVVPALRLGWSF